MIIIVIMVIKTMIMIIIMNNNKVPVDPAHKGPIMLSLSPLLSLKTTVEF